VVDVGATALVVIDVQKGFDQADYWGPRNNPECEDNIAELIAAWRRGGGPIVYVRHDSTKPGSPFEPGTPGNELREFVDGEPDLFVVKHVNSAFLGDPDLHAWLTERGLGKLVLCGVQTNHCVESTARTAADLGYEVLFVLDATHTFDREGPDGAVIPADDLARATAASLHGEAATVVATRNLLSR
jgi:nicotinamidase-related amidase